LKSRFGLGSSISGQQRETEKQPHTQVVLVAVEDLDALRKAYPNYYVDTSGFISAVSLEIGTPDLQEPKQQKVAEEQERQQIDLFGGAAQKQ
jgi:hypothetical protein